MLKLKWNPNCDPVYQTEYSAGADLKADEDIIAKAGAVTKVRTGVWISEVDWQKIPAGFLPEIQLRARSGLAFKHGITLANGVGTVDLDYPDEICVLLLNTSTTDFVVKKGDRIAQLLVALTVRLADLNVGQKRVGGFGSTQNR